MLFEGLHVDRADPAAAPDPTDAEGPPRVTILDAGMEDTRRQGRRLGIDEVLATAEEPPRSEVPGDEHLDSVAVIDAEATVIDIPRGRHYGVPRLNARIDRRFHQMLTEGALDEARANLPGWDARRPSAKAIGGPELIAHLKGEMSLETATEAATLASRQYAKRQRTWFRSNMKTWRRISLP